MSVWRPGNCGTNVCLECCSRLCNVYQRGVIFVSSATLTMLASSGIRGMVEKSWMAGLEGGRRRWS